MTYPVREDMNRPKKRRRTKQTTAKAAADRLFSQIVRAKGYCERCLRTQDQVQLQCAHWISRTYSNTRTDLDNAFCLCATCHRYFTNDPMAWSLWTFNQRGRETYDRLREAANEKSNVWWPDELIRLRAFAKQEGIGT